MSLEYIRKFYEVPAHIGGRVKFKDRMGTITGANGPHLLITLDGDNFAGSYHPTWKVDYSPLQTPKAHPHD